jgi:hypothetical protein
MESKSMFYYAVRISLVLWFLLALMFLSFSTLTHAADINFIRSTRDTTRPMFYASKTLSFGATDTTKSFTVDGYGKIHSIVAVVPDFTNTVTATITLSNANSQTFYTSDALTKNNTHIIQNLRSYVPVYGTNTLTVTLSGVPGGSGGSVAISIYME